jgi:tetratricopeptide (TPR) repeat protein
MSVRRRLYLALTVAALATAGCAGPVATGAADRPVDTTATKSAAPTARDEALRRGDAAWRADRPDEALRLYLEAAEADPQGDVALLRISRLHESLGRLDLAIRASQVAALRDPRNGLALQRLGFLWLRVEDAERAAQEFTRALRLDPRLWASCMGLGLAAEQRGDLASARMHYDEALILRPSSAELLAYSARVDLALGDLARARSQARASLAAGPSATGQLVWGDVLARSGGYADALEAYHAVLDAAAAYQRLGEQAMRRDDYPAAVGFFEDALRVAPAHSERATQRLAVARERRAAAARRATDR